MGFFTLHPLYQPFHLAHLASQEGLNGDFAAVGVKGDGGEAGNGRVDVIDIGF